MPIESGANSGTRSSPTPKPTFGAAPAPELTSEHGSGGGYTPGDTGATPTIPELSTGYPDVNPTTDDNPGADAAASSAGSTPSANTDWAGVFWGSLGLPGDLVNQINSIFKQYPDAQTAMVVAQSYLRTTDWFAQTFPGFGVGVQHGLFTDETGYRNYVNQINALSQQYSGQPVSTNAITNFLAQGLDPTAVNRQFEAGAFLNADQKLAASGMFSPDELSQIAQEAAGIGSQNGKYLAGLFNYATQVTPLLSQYGQGLDRNLVENYFKQGRSAADVGNILQGDSYAAANKGEINYEAGAFGTGTLSQDELNAYGEQKAGYTTDLGTRLQAMLDRAHQTMQTIFSGKLATPSGLTLGPQGLNAPGLAGTKGPADLPS